MLTNTHKKDNKPKEKKERGQIRSTDVHMCTDQTQTAEVKHGTAENVRNTLKSNSWPARAERKQGEGNPALKVETLSMVVIGREEVYHGNDMSQVEHGVLQRTC